MSKSRHSEYSKAATRRQLLASVVWLLDKTLIRVGNDEYARTNHSYGLTTMLKKHAKVKGTELSFSFRGKSGVEHIVSVDDPRLARIVQRSRICTGMKYFSMSMRTARASRFYRTM